MLAFFQPLLGLVRDFWRGRTQLEFAALALGLIIPIVFVVHTNQVWEDFLITYRHSENLVNGHGLVYQIGERVHGFTSPLNTLLPALFLWITKAPSYATPLLLFRLVSLAGLLVAMLSVLAILRREDPPSRVRLIACAFFPILVGLEIKTTAFAMNGQEAGLMLGFLAPGLVLAFLGWPRSGVGLGSLCLTGLMWTRPDGFVYGLALALGGLAFGAAPWRDFLRSFVRSTLIAIALYLPWAMFAQIYYGSFVPHTIIAKHGTQVLQSDNFGLMAPVAASIMSLPQRMVAVFAAIYDFQLLSGPLTWPKWSHDLALGLELAVVLYWLLPVKDRLGRLTSLCSLFVLCYLAYASLIAVSSPWYYPPLAFLSLLTLVRMVVTLPGYLGDKLGGILTISGVAILTLFLGFIFLNSSRALKIKQEIVDGKNRRELGLWLRENVKDHETVYLEPLGYIGYYSQRKMLDWPGLVAPEVVAARKKIGHPANSPWGTFQWGRGAEETKPDWIVARIGEVNQMKASEFLSREYRPVRAFNVIGEVLDAGTFYGCSVNYDDAVFQVFRRVPVSQVPGGPDARRTP